VESSFLLTLNFVALELDKKSKFVFLVDEGIYPLQSLNFL
jgi:hypothetical protein